jgi:hypothetical protein
VFSISLIRCEDRNTVLPSAASDRSSPRIQATPSGSSPLTGSSSSSTPGSPSSAAATPSRWVMPSENPPARCPATLSSPVIPSTAPTRRRPIPFARASASR